VRTGRGTARSRGAFTGTRTAGARRPGVSGRPR
jgi:hypothetical protein